ncbi:LAME_0E02300g1_1 [Lachancea meyersii CBS 8951]|uniref:LAME_0E02300g1_1 n=1 Tax=Lachancea meyersii CBS 8951 TaxID=1266667 RepID=A0A1G4JFV3_9SACH|nr:LAME_0E02300g1_1 [Lachancea meyersii CBS 8951]
MYVPVMTTCGHNYCYDCISNWLVSNNASELTCPQCRSPLEHPPALNATLQHLLSVVIEIGAGSDPQLGRTRAQSIAQYKNDVENNILYKDVFNNTAVAVVDDDDGVARCSNCHWEVEGDVCPHCNARMRNRTREYDEDEEEEILTDDSIQRSFSGARNSSTTVRADSISSSESEYGEDLDSDTDYVRDFNRNVGESRSRPAPFGSARDILNRINAQDRRQNSEDEDENDSDLNSFIVDEAEEDELEESSYTSSREGKSARVPVRLDDSDNSGDEDKERDSDFWEHNDEDGFASGDNLDSDGGADEDTGRKIKKRRFQVIEDSDEED